jgi:DNA-binding GntR family transcriptional regulator
MIDEAARMRCRLAERLTDVQYRPFLRADMAFHLLLLRAAGNYAAFKIVSDTFLRSQIHGRHPSRRDPAAIARVWALHGNIARAVQQGNAKAARRWLHAHLAESRRDALMTFDRNPQPVVEHRNSPDAEVVMDETVDQLVSAEAVDKL